jgi:SAM-dependent methyltransferase
VRQLGAPLSIPQRITWAVAQLKPVARDRILEIGCGNGQALARIAALAPRCSVVGIDRSPLQVQKARARLRNVEAPPGWRIEPVTLVEAVSRWPAAFNKVLAINVNAFWVEPRRSLPALAGLLTRTGRAYVAYEPPSLARATALESELSASLESYDCRVRRLLVQRFERTAFLCFVIQRAS